MNFFFFCVCVCAFCFASVGSMVAPSLRFIYGIFFPDTRLRFDYLDCLTLACTCATQGMFGTHGVLNKSACSPCSDSAQGTEVWENTHLPSTSNQLRRIISAYVGGLFLEAYTRSC
jgi:hypothetical protein